MGQFLYSITQLPSPFTGVMDRVATIPAGSRLAFRDCFRRIVIVLGGRVNLHCTSLGKQPLQAGDIAILPKDELVTYTPLDTKVGTSYHTFIIKIANRLPSLEHKNSDQQQHLERIEKDFKAYIHYHFDWPRVLPQAMNQRIDSLLASIRQEADIQSTGYRHRIMGLCVEVAIELVRQSQSSSSMNETAEFSQNTRYINATNSFLKENLHRTLDLNEIAWNVRLSSEHLARVYKRETGKTIFEHLAVLRIDKVKTALVFSRDNLEHIANATGFTSAHSMGRKFKELTGMSPSTFRKTTGDQFSPSQTDAIAEDG